MISMNCMCIELGCSAPTGRSGGNSRTSSAQGKGHFGIRWVQTD